MNRFKNLISTFQEQYLFPENNANISHDLHFRCLFHHGIKLSQLEKMNFPKEMAEFYQLSNGAYLFQDARYGQWGLHLLDLHLIQRITAEFFEDRYDDALTGDRIIGEFLGDGEKLLVRLDPNIADFGTIIIVCPISPRNEWRIIETNFYDFIINYFQNSGEKYWENLNSLID